MSRPAWIVVGVLVAVVAVVTLVWAVRLLLRLFAVRRVRGIAGVDLSTGRMIRNRGARTCRSPSGRVGYRR
jgi:hypothetical protein